MFPFRQMRFGRRGWLRPWMLFILNRGPKNGAEIIDEIEKSSFGAWRPSPGSVYPLLDEIMQEGLIQKKEDGRYELTEQGKQEVEWPFGAPAPQRGNSLEGILSEMKDYVSYLEDLNRSDPAKLLASKDKLTDLVARISKLSGS